MGFIVDLRKCAELAARNEWVTNDGDPDSKECVAAVKALIAIGNKLYSTSSWRRGKKVMGNNIMPGTAIATFRKDGSTGKYYFKGHAAIFVDYRGGGFVVYDQWKPSELNPGGRRFSKRIIPLDCADSPSNNADAFYVIELIEEAPNGLSQCK
ncbi:MAG: BPSL0067 family protein [Azoarcus sp.]|jgi:hypothetical protein|nr:BPSL0067 family protein [Azoarcus sp.]